MNRSAHIITYGCQMNRQESGVMAGLLAQAGYVLVENFEAADLVVVETCAIRQKAEHKVYSLLGRLRKHRSESRPGLKIALCGCVVTPEAAADLVRRQGVDIVLGPRRIARIVEAARDAEEEPVIDVGVDWALPPDEISAPDIPGLSAFVTVMQGCSNSCSFCVVPSRRGAAQSRPIGEIIAEINRLGAAGYQEVTLLGQNISFYGLDDPRSRVRLADLLERADADCDIPRLRFATSHPAYIDDRFIETFAGLRRVMPHLHLPVQSGSDGVLRAMNRGYTAERYAAITDAVRSARPEATISTDLIAGFDGETEEDHRATIRLVERVGLDGGYVFHYSERRGTRSVREKLGEPVPVPERMRRCREVLEAVERVAQERNNRRIGSAVEVLVERPGSGRERGNIQVQFEGSVSGRFVRVLIERVTPFALIGRVAP